jgi:hypothetical protein
MMSPATSGRWNSVRRSISPEPTSRRFFCAGASWIRRAGFASAFFTSTWSPMLTPALPRCRPSSRITSSPSSSG